MKVFLETVKRIFFILYLLFLHIVAGFFIYEKFINPYFEASRNEIAEIQDPTVPTPVPTVLPIPSIEPTATPEATEFNANQTVNTNQSNIQTNNPNTSVSAEGLMIPVVGIKREQLQDTFNDARSENRVHNAIDIMAPGGTPVVAAADGEIAKFFDSERGGITIYQYSVDRRYAYYYAHLQKRADNLKEKDFVKRGTIIGFVGDTGNSGAGNYHLHFTITILNDGQSYWQGTDINPYPLLKEALEAR